MIGKQQKKKRGMQKGGTNQRVKNSLSYVPMKEEKKKKERESKTKNNKFLNTI